MPAPHGAGTSRRRIPGLQAGEEVNRSAFRRPSPGNNLAGVVRDQAVEAMRIVAGRDKYGITILEMP
ncbi:hypothetical protein [Yinghuangia seranimata]|uniref:hypothetical protein n=1 Tax=Yinghuangia seranimata TaxID=408067 RepID=UPI00248BDC8D|nr:hypothetical protein [Yinghuangia seranimata]MDI2128464.1 hypothetical protein [Yinghuangia seranimata]